MQNTGVVARITWWNGIDTISLQAKLALGSSMQRRFTYSETFDMAMLSVKSSENVIKTNCSRSVSRLNWKWPSSSKIEQPNADVPVCIAVSIQGNANCSRQSPSSIHGSAQTPTDPRISLL